MGLFLSISCFSAGVFIVTIEVSMLEPELAPEPVIVVELTLVTMPDDASLVRSLFTLS